MFKRAKKITSPTVEPAPPAWQIEANKARNRASLLSSLANEAEMWRKFSKGCAPGRRLHESSEHSWSGYPQEDSIPRLHLTMDEASSSMWKAFAESMATVAEQRLKEIL